MDIIFSSQLNEILNRIILITQSAIIYFNYKELSRLIKRDIILNTIFIISGDYFIYAVKTTVIFNKFFDKEKPHLKLRSINKKIKKERDN